MSVFSILKKTAATGLFGVSVVALTASGAVAAPYKGPTIDSDPGVAIDPPPLLPSSIPPLEPSPGFPDTDERPVLVDSGCFFDAVWMNFSDPDGPDLQMTIEAGYTTDWHAGPGAYQVVEVGYVGSGHDFWSIDASDWDDDSWFIIQATDEDGNTSVAYALKRGDFGRCYVVHEFDHGQDRDFWEAIGRR